MGLNQNKYNFATRDISVIGDICSETINGIYYDAVFKVKWDTTSMTQTTEHANAVPEVVPPSPTLVSIGGISKTYEPINEKLSILYSRIFTVSGGFLIYVKLGQQTIEDIWNTGKGEAKAIYAVSFGELHPHDGYAKLNLTIDLEASGVFAWSGRVGVASIVSDVDVDTDYGGYHGVFGTYINQEAFNDRYATNGVWDTSCDTATLSVGGLMWAMMKSATKPEWWVESDNMQDQLENIKANAHKFSLAAKITEISENLSVGQIGKASIIGTTYTQTNPIGLAIGSTMLGCTGTQLFAKGETSLLEGRFAAAIQVETYSPDIPGTLEAARDTLFNRCTGTIRVEVIYTEGTTQTQLDDKLIAVSMTGYVSPQSYTIPVKSIVDTYDSEAIHEPSACPARIETEFYDTDMMPFTVSGFRNVSFVVLATKLRYRPDSVFYNYCDESLKVGKVCGGSASGPLGRQWQNYINTSYTTKAQMVAGIAISGTPKYLHKSELGYIEIEASVGNTNMVSDPPEGQSPNTNFPCW